MGLPATSTLAGDDEWVYAVSKRDTLISIADTYLEPSVGWAKLQKFNNISNFKLLQPNSKLRIPVAWLKRSATVAEVLRVQGEVKIENITKSLSPADKLSVGDTISTGTESSSTLRFIDGSRLLLAENSNIKLVNLLVYGKTGLVETKLQLNQGSLDTQVAHQIGGARYEVQSPAMNLGVRGTDFRVGVNATTGESRSEVLGGRVAAQGSGNLVALNAGYGTKAEPGKPPLLPKALLSAPEFGEQPSVLKRVPLKLKWQPVAGASAYRAQVFADKAFERLVKDGVFKENSAKWVDLADGQYILRVRAIDQDGLEGLNAHRDFTLKARPEPPFITEPTDGQKVYGDEAALRWTKSASAVSYRVQLSSTEDFSKMLLDKADGTGSEEKVALTPGKYFWRIASLTAEGDKGPYSDVQGFTQRKIPASPDSSPPAVSEKELRFGWKANEEGQKFQFQFAQDKDFQQLLLDKTVKESAVVIPRPKSGSYFMHVKTIDADGFAGPFGPTQQVEVPPPPPPPPLIFMNRVCVSQCGH